MIVALQVVGGVLGAVSVLWAAGAMVFVVGMIRGTDSAGLAVLLVGGAATYLWQALAGGALALLCFAAARLLGATRA